MLYFDVLFLSLCASLGIISPNPTNTNGVTILRVSWNGSSEYIPPIQANAVNTKHHNPINIPIVLFFVNLYSALNLSPAFLRAIYATNTHK